jgi:hypothetical protein
MVCSKPTLFYNHIPGIFYSMDGSFTDQFKWIVVLYDDLLVNCQPGEMPIIPLSQLQLDDGVILQNCFVLSCDFMNILFMYLFRKSYLLKKGTCRQWDVARRRREDDRSGDQKWRSDQR